MEQQASKDDVVWTVECKMTEETELTEAIARRMAQEHGIPSYRWREFLTDAYAESYRPGGPMPDPKPVGEWDKLVLDLGDANRKVAALEAQLEYAKGINAANLIAYEDAQAQLAAMREAADNPLPVLRETGWALVRDVHEAFPEGLRPALGPLADLYDAFEAALRSADMEQDRPHDAALPGRNGQS